MKQIVDIQETYSRSEIDAGRLFRQVLGEVEYGPAFAYLFRRFGYPLNGWDPHKQIVRYDFVAENNLVAFCVNPTPCWPRTYWGVRAYIKKEFMITQIHESRFSFGHQYEESGGTLLDNPKYSLTYQSYRALEAEFKDLLTPVDVDDDMPINIKGKVSDSYEGERASYSDMAGYGLLWYKGEAK